MLPEEVMQVVRARGRTALMTLALVSLTTACAGPRPLALPGKNRDPREMPGSTSSRGGREDLGQANGLEAKHVAGKEPPATLIAEDGDRCTVPEPRYRDVRIGEKVLCAWRTGDRAP
jgi:hypothetical protein